MKQYNYAVVDSGKSILDSPQKLGFSTYEKMFEDIYDWVQPDRGEFIMSYYFRRSQVDAYPIGKPRPVASITYTSDNPNEWVTKVFMTSIVVWTSEVNDVN